MHSNRKQDRKVFLSRTVSHMAVTFADCFSTKTLHHTGTVVTTHLSFTEVCLKRRAGTVLMTLGMYSVFGHLDTEGFGFLGQDQLEPLLFGAEAMRPLLRPTKTT